MVLPRFLAELKHRNVYRGAVVYAAVGWALLEVSDVVLPRLGLPDWAVNVVLAIVLLGFPLALVFAWIFDLNTQGIVRTPDLAPEVHHHFSITSIVEFFVICILVVTVGYLYVDRLSLQRMALEPAIHEKPEASQVTAPNSEQYRAIAVLPFADMSETRDQAWFAEGVAEELLLALSGVDELKVMARTSSFAFKDTDKTIAEIADILGVQAVLEGSVRRSSDRVRITAKLVDARSGYHIWSGSYERQLTDIFALQDELAQSLVSALRIQLGVRAPGTLIKEQTQIPEAYNAFIRGRSILGWGLPENPAKSISYFEQAVAADPNYAPAWGYLSWAYSSTPIWQQTSESAVQSAQKAYERALKLNPEQSEALAAKAWMTQLMQWEWVAANKLYLQAIASGENTVAMFAYGMNFLPAIDLLPEGLRMLQQVEQRDPLNASYKATLAYFLLESGDATAAIHKAREAIELDPEHVFAWAALLDAYNTKGDFSAAGAALKNLPEFLAQHPRLRLRFAFWNMAQGNLSRAREIYQSFIDDPTDYGIIILAQLALRLGEIDQALEIMERGVEQHSWNSMFIRLLYRRDEAVKDHPRYIALLKRISLDDESVADLHSKLLLD